MEEDGKASKGAVEASMQGEHVCMEVMDTSMEVAEASLEAVRASSFHRSRTFFVFSTGRVSVEPSINNSTKAF